MLPCLQIAVSLQKSFDLALTQQSIKLGIVKHLMKKG